MRRPFVSVVVVALALTATGVSASVASAATPPPTKTVSIAGSGCPAGKQYCFKAPALTVKSGTKVVWKNNSVAPHDVTRCTVLTCGVTGGTGKDLKFKSKEIGPGKTYAFTFKKKGTYRYTCIVHHPTMRGTITVK